MAPNSTEHACFDFGLIFCATAPISSRNKRQLDCETSKSERVNC